MLRKARKAARKLFRKKGAKNKPKNKEQHDDQVKAGLQYLKQQTAKVDEDKNKSITAEEAKEAAARTKKKFKVFKSITPKQKGANWSFEWKASSGILDVDVKVETSTHGALKVGNHPLKGDGKESHHVPAKQLAYTLRNFYTSVGDILPDNPAYEDLKEEIKTREKQINKNHGGDGKNLSAILLAKSTHRTGKKAVHKSAIQSSVYSDMKKLAGSIENGGKRIIVVIPKSGEERTLANLRGTHWQSFIKQMYIFKKNNSDVLDINTKKDEALFVINAGTSKGNESIAAEIKEKTDKVQGVEAHEDNSTQIKLLMNQTAESTFDVALDIGVDQVSKALEGSTVDGDSSKHSGALKQLKTTATNIWKKIIIKPF